MTKPRTYALPSSVTLTVSGDEALLLNLADETMFSLNATGARVVELIVEGHGLDDILELLSAQYGADRGELEGDVVTLIDTLASGGLIVAVAEGADDC